MLYAVTLLIIIIIIKCDALSTVRLSGLTMCFLLVFQAPRIWKLIIEKKIYYINLITGHQNSCIRTGYGNSWFSQGVGGVFRPPIPRLPKNITLKVYFEAFGSFLLIRIFVNNVKNLLKYLLEYILFTLLLLLLYLVHE